MLIYLYDYAHFAAETAAILYFLHGLPWRGGPKAVKAAAIALMPMLLALRSGADGLALDPFSPFRLAELFVMLVAFALVLFRVNLREGVYFCAIIFLVEVAVEKAVTALVMTGIPVVSHADILLQPGHAALYLVLPGLASLAVFWLLKRFFVTVCPKDITWRELAPMLLSTVPVLYIGMAGDWVDAPQLGLLLVSYLLCSFTSILVMTGVDNIVTLKEEEKEHQVLEALMGMQRDQYERKQVLAAALRQTHHDLGHHIRYMATLDDPDERHRYAQEVLDQVQGTEELLCTGNETLDVLLSDRIRRCRQEDVKLVLFVEAARMDRMRPSDIVVVVGNALENAMEAVRSAMRQGAVAPEDRQITVRISGNDNWLVLRFENRLFEPLSWDGAWPATTKPNGDAHGFGLKSIARVVERYHGDVQILEEDGRFVLSVLVPVPSEHGNGHD